MKSCPKCKRSFADGFKYCPKDATELDRCDLRAALHAQNEFRFLLEDRSFLSSLKEALRDAAAELRNSPLNFLIQLTRGEGSNRRRRNLIQAGLATGIIVYSIILMAALIAGIFKMPVADRVVRAETPGDRDPMLDPVMMIFPAIAEKVHRAGESGKGLLGGSLQDRSRPQGGGGGNHKEAASRGVHPTPSLSQQINPPDPLPAKIINSTLLAPESVFADPKSFVRMKGPIGIFDGQTQIPSPGAGPGTGVGPGNGPGYGPGKDGNTGDGKMKPGGGSTTGPDDQVYNSTADLKPMILYKEKAKYTEEARQNRVAGVVVLSVIFGADGRIRNIRVVRQLPFGLTETAIEAAQRIRFQPAMRQGRPVNVRALLEYNFALY